LCCYKGRISPKQIERDFPHSIDIPIPEGGLRRRLDQMHEWHLVRGIHAKLGSAGLWTARFCFSDPATAEEFARAFRDPPN